MHFYSSSSHSRKGERIAGQPEGVGGPGQVGGDAGDETEGERLGGRGERLAGEPGMSYRHAAQ